MEKNTHPFENAVSRSDIRSTIDQFDISRVHKDVDMKFKRLARSVRMSRLSKLLPILGKAGAGKTHYYWILKDLENRSQNSPHEAFRTIFVPSPTIPLQIPLHILTCLIDDYGKEIIKQTAENMITRFRQSAIESMETIRRRMISYFGGTYSDIIRILLKYVSHDTKEAERDLCERWLFADSLDEQDLHALHIKNNIENDQDAFALLRIFDEFNGQLLVFYFDEMELLNRIHGAEAEVRLWEIIKKLFNESHQSLFLTTCLLDVWDRVQANVDESITSRFEPAVELLPFEMPEWEMLYIRIITAFWQNYFLIPPPNIYFPLSKHIIEVIFGKSQGNPRILFKLVGELLDKIIDHEVEPVSMLEGASEEEIQKFFDRYAEKTPQKTSFMPTHEDFIRSKALRNVEQSHNQGFLPLVLQSALNKAKIVVEEEVYFVNVTPTAIISAIKSFFSFFQGALAATQAKIGSIEINYPFLLQNQTKSIPLMVKFADGRKIGFLIPLIKDFRTVSKAKAYFYVMECASYLTRNIFQQIVLLIPPNLIPPTSSLQRELEEYAGELLIIELDEVDAQKCVELAHPRQYSQMLDLEPFEKVVRFCLFSLADEEFGEVTQKLRDFCDHRPKGGEKLDTENFNAFLLKLNE